MRNICVECVGEMGRMANQLEEEEGEGDEKLIIKKKRGYN